MLIQNTGLVVCIPVCTSRCFVVSPLWCAVLFLCLGLCVSPHGWIHLHHEQAAGGTERAHQTFLASWVSRWYSLSVSAGWRSADCWWVRARKWGLWCEGISIYNRTRGYKMENLMQELLGKQNLRTKRLISCKCLIYGKFDSIWIFLFDRELVRSLSHVNLGMSFARGMNRRWPRWCWSCKVDWIECCLCN